MRERVGGWVDRSELGEEGGREGFTSQLSHLSLTTWLDRPALHAGVRRDVPCVVPLLRAPACWMLVLAIRTGVFPRGFLPIRFEGTTAATARR